MSAAAPLWSSGALFLTGSMLGNGLNYLFAMYFARALGAADFGLLTLALTVFNITVLFAPFGLETAALRFVSQRRAGESARQIIIGCAAIAGAMGLTFGLMLFVGADVVAERIFGKPELAPLLRLIAFGITPVAICSVLIASLQALHRVPAVVFIRNGVEPLGKFLLAAAAVAAGFGVFGVVGALVSIYFLSVTLAGVCLWRLPALGRGSASNTSPWTDVIRFSLPIVVSNLFGIISARSDLIAIGRFLPTHDVAIYAAAAQTAAIVALLLSAIESAVTAPIGNALGRGDYRRVGALAKTASRWVLTLATFVFIELALFAHEILGWFGPTFAGGAACLVVLALGHICACAAVSSNAIVLMAGRSRWIMMNAIGFGVALIGTNFLVVPRFGIFGAACATASCVGIGSIVVALQARAISGVVPYSWANLKVLAAGALAFAAGVFCMTSGFTAPGLITAVGVAFVYLLALLAMRLDPLDRALITMALQR